jgi:hypothetical protein
MIDKGDIPSIPCKMSLRGPKSMRKIVDGLSRILIDIYVPLLTPRLNSSETSLQLSEKQVIFIHYCTATAVHVRFEVSAQPRVYTPQEYSCYLRLLTTSELNVILNFV